MKDIGIGILDIYEQKNLDDLLNSIPKEYTNNLYICSTANNKQKITHNHFSFTREVSLSSLVNRILTFFRQNPEIKYYFIFHSNCLITDSNFFKNTILTAEAFGTWFITGPGSDSVLIEEENLKINLAITPELNQSFLFTIPNIIKHNGYFNEQFYADNILGTLDYLIKLRQKELYPSAPFNPSVYEGLSIIPANLKKAQFKPTLKAEDKSLGLFYYLHKFIPGVDDNTGSTKEQMLKSIEKLQQRYARVSKK